MSEHHPQVGAAHILDGNCHLGEEREGVKQSAAGARGRDYTWRREHHRRPDLYERHILSPAED